MTNGFSKHFFRIMLSFSLILSLIVGSSAPALAADSSTIDVKMTVTYGQTEARSMLDYINKFRSGQDVDGQKADYLNKDNTTKTDLTGQLQPLSYDYNLEKVAMQRAAEVAMTFEHYRPDGTRCFTAWDGTGTWYSMGENIA